MNPVEIRFAKCHNRGMEKETEREGFPANVVYWIVDGNGVASNGGATLDLPRSTAWTNDLHMAFGEGEGLSAETYRRLADGAAETLRKDRPRRFAVVTDAVDPDILAYVRSKFVPNSVVSIGSAPYDREKVGRQIEWILSGFGRDDKAERKVWFVSDTHFNHANIIRYCNRPWHGKARDEGGEFVITEHDVRLMNEAMIGKWNEVVGKDDIVWHLGDFCLGKDQKTAIPELVSRLNGKIRLVMGNHDRHSVKFYYDAGFDRVYDRPVVINGFCMLSHAPIEIVRGPFFNIAGHVHDCTAYSTWSRNSCIVCVERHGYRPVSWDEIKRHVDRCDEGEME